MQSVQERLRLRHLPSQALRSPLLQQKALAVNPLSSPLRQAIRRCAHRAETFPSSNLMLHARTRDIDATADDQVVVVGPVVKRSAFGRDELDDIGEVFLDEPAFQLVDRVMRLVTRSVPVEVVAHSKRPVGMVREVGDLVERPVQDGNAAEQAEPGTERLEQRAGSRVVRARRAVLSHSCGAVLRR